MKAWSALSLAATALAAAACSGSPADAPATSTFDSVANACQASGTVDAGAPDTGTTPTLTSSAEAEAWNTLNSFLQPYFTDQVIVYRGTYGGSDNQSVLGPAPKGKNPGYVDQSIPDGPAVATLYNTTGLWTLEIHSLAQHKYVLVRPDVGPGGADGVSIILPDTVYGGTGGTCAGCIPSLSKKPASISFDANATAVVNVSTTGKAHDVTLKTSATASLTRVHACALTTAEVAELGATSGLEFIANGTSYEAPTSGWVGANGCNAQYTAVLWVSASDVTSFGVKDIKLSNKMCWHGAP